jgi:hypothetical protein
MPTYYFIIGLIIVVLVWLGHGVWRIGAVSAGATIPENRSAQALILVDLQTVFWDGGPYSEDDKTHAQAAILNEINLAKERGDTIVALRHEWSIPSTKLLARLTMKGQAIAGTLGTEIAKPFAGLADHEILKRVQDGFESGELDALFADATSDMCVSLGWITISAFRKLHWPPAIAAMTCAWSPRPLWHRLTRPKRTKGSPTAALFYSSAVTDQAVP